MTTTPTVSKEAVAVSEGAKPFAVRADGQVAMEPVRVFRRNGMAERHVEEPARSASVLHIYAGSHGMRIHRIARDGLRPYASSPSLCR